MASNDRRVKSGLRSREKDRGGVRKDPALLAYLRVRGNNPPEDVVIRCLRLADAIGQARRTFRDFDSRNPWMFYDGVARIAYLLVDEEQRKFTSGGKR